MRVKLVGLLFCALIPMLAIAGCGSDDDSSGDGGSSKSTGSSSNLKDADITVSIGGIVPLTGDLSQTGGAYVKASKLAVEQAQKALKAQGLSNVKIEIKHADSGASPDEAVAAARSLIQGGANCLTGPLDSPSTIAVARSAAVPARVPQISPSASSPQFTGVGPGFVYRLAPSDALQGKTLGERIVDDLGGTGTVTLAGRNDAFGQGILPPVKEALEAGGVTVKGPIYYDPNVTSFDSEASKIVEGSPDATVIIDFLQTYGKLSAALVRTGKFDAKTLYLAGAWPAEIPDYIPKQGLEGARGTSPTSDAAAPAAVAFDKLYKAGGDPKERQASDQNNFDATMLCILAALKAGSDDPKAIAENIEAVSGAKGGKEFTWETLGDGIAAIAAGEDVNYEGVGGPGDLKHDGDVKSGLYKVFVYKGGAQETVDTVQATG
jgi:ABC-type branched-subunit amino acid transport system substrate-binding protein